MSTKRRSYSAFKLVPGEKTCVMGVLNVTPDSFSDGGRFFDPSALRHAQCRPERSRGTATAQGQSRACRGIDKQKAAERALQMAEEGAGIIDIGGESTRPGAKDVSEEEEIARVVPVIKSLAGRMNAAISIDTRKAPVARRALEAGARIVNDVSGLRFDKDMAAVVADSGAALIVMHMKGSPRDMQRNPTYKNLIAEIIKSLKDSIALAKKAGVSEDKIIIDPGIGFGKTLEHNLEILRRLDEFKTLGLPICVGASRKSFIGKALGIYDTDDRLAGSIAAAVIAVMNGADIVRVHDVKETAQAVRIADKILGRMGR